MEKKADAWQAYNEAAIAQMFIEKLPELARAIAEPLTKIEKIVLVNTGGDGGVGASRITKEVVDILAQLPPAIQALTGQNLQDLIRRVPGLSGAGKDKPTDKPEAKE